jgi:8-oxo-dGTP diphosphatase
MELTEVSPGLTAEWIDLEKPTKPIKVSSGGRMHTRVGVAVLVVNDGQILLGKRINSHGDGTWNSPGGHLEFGESPQECASRELQEETGLIAKEIIEGTWTNDFFEEEGKHYVTLYMIVPQFTGVPTIQEPEKCLGWQWFDFNDLPSPLFLPLVNLLKEHSLREIFASS